MPLFYIINEIPCIILIKLIYYYCYYYNYYYYYHYLWINKYAVLYPNPPLIKIDDYAIPLQIDHTSNIEFYCILSRTVLPIQTSVQI